MSPLETTVPSLRALAHPIRLRILSMVTARPVSATEVAAVTGLAHAAASYHLRQLATAGLIEPIASPPNEVRASGRPLRRYRMRAAGFSTLGRRGNRAIHQALLRAVEARLRLPLKASHSADAEVWLDPADWRAVLALLAKAETIVHQRARTPGSRSAKHVGFTSVLVELRT